MCFSTQQGMDCFHLDSSTEATHIERQRNNCDAWTSSQEKDLNEDSGENKNVQV